MSLDNSLGDKDSKEELPPPISLGGSQDDVVLGAQPEELRGRFTMWGSGGWDTGDAKDEPSVKKRAQKKVEELVTVRKVGSRIKVEPLVGEFYFSQQKWFPFTKYVLERGWETHAARLRSDSRSPILAPFGKKLSWKEVIAYMAKIVKTITDPDLMAWETRELEDYGRSDFSRHSYDPTMYLGRLLSYDPVWYGETTKLSTTAMQMVPQFRPLSKLSDIWIAPDARKANTGFPWLKPLSMSGQDYRISSVYQDVIEAAAEWTTEVLQLKRVTTQSVLSISPPIAVFERAQSDGRPVHDVSKKTNFPQFRFTQPLIAASEGLVPGYAHGDRRTLINQMREFVSGSGHFALAKGDDLAVRCRDGRIVGVDASSFDAAVNAGENIQFIEAVASKISASDELATLWRATCYAENADLATSVGMLHKAPYHGVISGAGRTSLFGTMVSLARAGSVSTVDPDTVVSQMSRFAPYTTEFIGTGCCILLKLYYTEKNPTRIHGSFVRAAGGACQRESPVLAKRLDVPFATLEEARLLALAGNLYGHQCFEEFCSWVRHKWEFRVPKARLISLGEQIMEKGPEVGRRDRAQGSYEREGLAAAADLMIRRG